MPWSNAPYTCENKPSHACGHPSRKKGEYMDSTRHPSSGWDAAADEAVGYDDWARRILNLFFVLNASKTPISTSHIIFDADLGYNSGNPDSDKRKFKRDRDELARFGVHVVEHKAEGATENEESSWVIDRTQTQAELGILTTDDADILLAALRDYAGQPGIPYRSALTHIIAKLDNEGAAGAGNTAASDAAAGGDPVFQALWAAFTLRKNAVFTYTDAQGATTKKRSVDIWGFFTQDECMYFVGFDHGREAARTFRVDRVRSVNKPGKAYAIPDDFNVTDYQFLPFDLADTQAVDASFTFPQGLPAAEIEAITHGRGSLGTGSAGERTWTIPARDLTAAASFALGHAGTGMRPLSPRGLVEAWNNQIAKVVAAHDRA